MKQYGLLGGLHGARAAAARVLTLRCSNVLFVHRQRGVTVSTQHILIKRGVFLKWTGSGPEVGPVQKWTEVVLLQYTSGPLPAWVLVQHPGRANEVVRKWTTYYI